MSEKCQSGCPKPNCPPPANCGACSPETKNGSEKAKCDPNGASSSCGSQGRPFYSCPTECKFENKFDLDAGPVELTSGDESWCSYGLRILFTNPPMPVDIKPEVGCPVPMTLCVQFRNEACISPECVTALCRSNLKTNENPEGDEADFCMPLNMCLSQYECFTQTHMYQLCLVPTGADNKDVKFKIEYMNLTIWAEEEAPKEEPKEETENKE